ncbi:hypothetical protein GUI51_09345 [Enterococcus mundtii]|uniref:DNA-binding protein n=1 Tax=Enterococcus mundtii TaxID=53346 RepID=A0ABQ0VCB4_ENTMU|nr:hypothetical protein [Enterococcus mundtii]GEN18126.1 hypothetical protein LAC02_14070 [Ligilactobacillus acidipiscis]AUB53020.1 hypothetical protein EM4838_08440 [Enterococcus mundtii]MZZ58336.1 hypothetical protein [Enterococcus mundtii]MZZ61312.1 hypothetical protein [Enterococcus mundtii]MZZ68296.1 hypothetical protein [Enterococcus mundtii]
MNILSDEFLTHLRVAIVEIIKDAIKQISTKNLSETRYLKKTEAKKYVGGVNEKGFEKLIAHGLKEIRIDGFLRYDKKDIDELMAKYKI